MSDNQAYAAGADRTSELPPSPDPSGAGPAADTAAYRVPQPPPAAQPYPTTAHPYPSTAQSYPATAQSYPTTAQPYPSTAQPYPTTTPPAVAQPGRGRRGLAAGAAALAIGLTSGVVGGFVGYALHPDGPSSPLQVPGLTGNGDPAPVVDRSSLSEIASQLQPAIVDIRTDSGEGSGVIISADGHIVTNHHVVQSARTVTVTFNSGQQLSGRVVGTDERTDLAVVQVDAQNLAHATWGDSDSVQIGDTVLAMGSPLGLQGSVTAGIISGLHRTITAGSDQRPQSEAAATIGDAIQTDAPINAGNSGGALVNTRGEVIGINTAIATNGTSGNIGVGFAISSNRARSVADAIIAGRQVSHPYLGVEIADAPSGGASVRSVAEGSAADQAGIQAGDVITKIGDRPIRGMEDLIAVIQSSQVGAQVPVTVVRDGTEQVITVTIGEN